MSQRFILGIGSERCGTLSLAHVLAAQPETHTSQKESPLLHCRTEADGSVFERTVCTRAQNAD